ncbi:MAG: hypothetical protein U9N52_04815 [Campylobacterota bacterium]|nr:hypothetical protein [Campylobacterota bacterium]
MKTGTKADLARFLGVSTPMISKHSRKGVFNDCYLEDGKTLDFSKAIDAIKKSKSRASIKEMPEIKEEEQKKSINIPKSARNLELDNKENNNELENLLENAVTSSQKVMVAKDFWAGKINEQKFLKEQRELITLTEAKGVIEVMFSPLSRKLDDIHMDLKSRFPDVPMEAVEWLNEYVNDIKKSVSSHKW